MSPRLSLLLALSLNGCLTTGNVSAVIERHATGLETLADPDGQHLVVRELSTSDDVVELVVSTAQRELEVERYELVESTTESRGWKAGGKAGRNLLWVASAAAGWVGTFGVSWETSDGRTVQIGGLGEDAKTWQGVTALVAALGGIGTGAQQTIAVLRPGRTASSVIGSEQVLLGSQSIALEPLTGQALDLAIGGASLLSTSTDGDGRAALSALQLPVGSWSEGLGLTATDLGGTWRPSDGLRQSLTALPADWSAPFHASLLDDLAGVALEVERGGASTELPLAELKSPASTRAQLETLPAEQQAGQAQAWIDQLTPLAEAAAAQRESVNLGVLRSQARVAQQTTGTMGANLIAMGELQTDDVFPPLGLFHQLPDDAIIPTDQIGKLRMGSSDSRVVVLEPGPCAVSEASDSLAAGRALVECSGAQVMVVSDADLPLSDARAWAVVGALDAPVGLRGLGSEQTRWVPVVRPLYAGVLAVDAGGVVRFGQVLDEEGLLESGVLRRVGE